MRQCSECFFLFVCLSAFRDLCVYLPTSFRISVYLSFCVCVHVYVSGVRHAIVYLFAFRHSVLGFWVVFSFYCLLEQIEGVTLSSLDTIFSGVIKSRLILFK